MFYTSINEVYYGKTKEILEIENTLDQIREKYENTTYDARINADPLVIKLSNQISDYFGFGQFFINIVQSNQYNAATYPLSVEIDNLNIKSNFIVKNGYKYNKDADYQVIFTISQSFLTSDRFTTPEIMAIILHEIGHNFSSVVSENILTVQYIKGFYLLVTSFLQLFYNANVLEPIKMLAYLTKPGRSIVIQLNRLIREECPGIARLIGYVNAASGFIKNTIYNVFGIVNFFTFGYINVPIKVANAIAGAIIFVPTGYQDEKIADAFATAYGYSNELSSALAKAERYKGGITTEYWLSQVPIIGELNQIMSLPGDIIVRALDEHPEFIERQNAQIRMLRRELEKGNLDPRLKNRIKVELRELEEAQEDFLKIKNKVGDNLAIKKLYWAWLLKMNDGDIKHLLLDDNYIGRMDDAELIGKANYTKFQDRMKNLRLK